MPAAKFNSIETLPDAVSKKVAEEINKKAAGIDTGTKTQLRTLLGGVAGTDPKLLKEAPHAEAAQSIKKLAEVVKAPPATLTDTMRKDIHDKIFKTLELKVKADPAGPEHDFTDDIEAIKKSLVAAPAPAPTPATPAGGPQVAPSITTADSPPLLTRRNAAIAGSLAIGAPLVAAGTAGTASMLGGGTFMGGVNTLGRTVGSLFAQPWRAIGGPALWNNLVVQPGNWLAGKLGIATGANATSGALAGMPGALGTTLGALGVAGGVYAGSKIINGVHGWVGGKMGYTPWKVPVIGGIPLIGSVANAAVAPLQFGLNGVGKVAGWGKKGLSWMFGKGKEAAAHRTSAAHFGLGALAGATILAPLTGGASLVWGLLGGHVARKGLKGKHFTDFVPAPFGVKKSAEGAAAH